MKVIYLVALLGTHSSLFCQQQWGGGFERQIEWSGVEVGFGGSQLGSSVDALGDLNGDGLTDFISGGPEAPSGGGDLSVGMVDISSGADGSLIRRHFGIQAGDRCGRAVTGLEDQNSDGISDYAYLMNGAVKVHSGADGQLIRNIIPSAGQVFHFGLDGAGDLNGDSIEDLFIFAYEDPWKSPVLAVSGFDGSTLWTTYGSTQFGHLLSLTSIPDITGDGIRECISGGSAVQLSEVTLYSGADGTILHSWTGTGQFGTSICSVGDYNGDGLGDIGISDPYAQVGSQIAAGRVQVYSGSDFSLLRSFEGSLDLPTLGLSISNAGDVDGDGFPDLAASAYDAPAKIAILSGQTGERIYIINRLRSGFDPLTTIKGLGDYNSDGQLDLLLGAPGAGRPLTGKVFIYSFRDFLTSSSATVSSGIGGSVTFDVDFPDDNWVEIRTWRQPMRYRLLFSGSGVGPTLLYDWKVPLGADSFLTMGMNGSYPAIFQNPEGRLDANGRATVALSLAPGIASSLIGTTLHFSAMQYEQFYDGTILAHGPSRAVSLEILP